MNASEQHRGIDAAAHYDERMRIFRAQRAAPGAIVFVGSSHFEWFDTDRFLPELRIVNRGIASDRLGLTERGILHRLNESVFDLEPTFIVFNNGVNDLGELWRSGTPAFDEIAACYDRVIGAIRDGTPRTPLLIVNEFPTTARFAPLNPNIERLNRRIERIARERGCAHLDFHSVVVDDARELRADLTRDGLHLNRAGYALLARSLATILPGIDPQREET